MDEPCVAYFDPPPDGEAAPARLPSPFDPGEPHPLARRAAEELIARLASHPGRDGLQAPGGGKMFGVLVVAAPDGRLGYLRGFSGMLDGAWHVPGFVPPLFDTAAQGAFWPAGQAQLAALERGLRALAASPDHAAAASRRKASSPRCSSPAATRTR